ncbi:MAG: helicase [Kajamanuvirus moutis]|uniref:Replication-associated protein n=1 Tax=Cressdnaviricota sp. TaxID=2748378 RepID=A0A345MYE2_9VIRU|nr:MAG: helicase [Cressdnaviricota sp.]
MQSKAIYWMLTIPHHNFVPWKPPGIQFIKGQLESGEESNYLHWQLFVVADKQSRLAAIKRIFGESVHCEATKSSAAEDYVWKEETAVAGTRFELGERKIKRNCPKDWERIKQQAIESKLDEIPADIFVRSYHSLKRISVDHARPNCREVRCRVFVGRTGSGKSHTAWSEAGLDAYPKDPLTKFWDGYQGHENVVIDEFRGIVSISHLLRWLDRYPMLVEIKGSATVLKAKNFWITSNLHPRQWYPELDALTYEALERRIEIVEMNEQYQ